MSPGPTQIFWDILALFFLKSTSAAAMVFSQRTLLRRSNENIMASPSQLLTYTARKSGWRIWRTLLLTFCTYSRTTSSCVTQCNIDKWVNVHMPIPAFWLIHTWITFVFWSLPEYPVLWHALVVRAPHYGVDQYFCHAHLTTAAIQILWFAT